MKDIPINTSFCLTRKVDSSMSALSCGSGELEVLATPHMAAMMEEASWRALAPYLEEDESSVGVSLCLEHSSATPMGFDVTVTSVVKEVNGREIVFEALAKDPAGEIGRASHRRFVISKERFMKKTKRKSQNQIKND